MSESPDFIVAGAGISGLAAALLLARRGYRIKIIERSSRVGGLAGAETFRGLPCDLGSHRLHPAALSSPILREIHRIHPFASRPRRGVLLLGDRRVSYPPSALEILRALGSRVAFSFAGRLLARRSKASFDRWDLDRSVRPGAHDAGFEQFVVERVGREAYRAFYAPYAEKVWGIHPSELSQSVAKRRVSTTSPLRLFGNVAGALAAIATGKPPEDNDTFLYPAEGVSAIARYLHGCLAELGVPIELGSPLQLDSRGQPVLFAGRLKDLVPTTLEHRGVYLVYIALPIERASAAETHYCPEPRQYFGRVSELSNYSPSLKRPGETILCAEIPEGRWGSGVDFASGARFGELYEQLERAGIIPRGLAPIEVHQRFVPDVYPLCRRGWLEEWEAAMARIVALGNVFPFGRQALFLHCNIDHCVDIATALAGHVDAGGGSEGLGYPRARLPRAPGARLIGLGPVDFDFHLRHHLVMRPAARRLLAKVLPRFSSSMAALLCVALGLAALPADAATYWTVPDLMKSFFSSSKKVTYKRISLADSEAADIAKRLGVESVKRDWLVYYGESGGHRDGYAIVDVEKGMHEPIDFAVRFTDSGTVDRIEVMAYREAYGDEIRSGRFRAQFSGKTASHPITAGKDIDIVSGASISCRSIAIGIKRDVLVLETALKNRSL